MQRSVFNKVCSKMHGYEPTGHGSAAKNAASHVRLIPLCERNYNLVELGPRGNRPELTISGIVLLRRVVNRPYDGRQHVRSGAINGKHKGMVSIWEVVAFNESPIGNAHSVSA